jgi:hypothetical protein
MAGGRGGARVGAGRKKKPLAEKLLLGGNGHHTVTKLKNPSKIPDNVMAGADMPPIAEYLQKTAKGTSEKIVPLVYAKTVEWLKKRGCEQYVNTDLIEQYALYLSRFVQCEEGVNTYGLLAKHPTTGAPIASPYVSMGLQFSKQANIYWQQIFQIVKENCSESVGKDLNPNDLLMEQLMRGKG